MVSICAACMGLQKHLYNRDGARKLNTNVLRWMHTSMPDLRSSSLHCRACALLLNGIFLYYDRFAGQREEDVWVLVESFQSRSGDPAQDHLSVAVRWKEHVGQEIQDDGYEQKDAIGYPDLKLEFFTGEGTSSPFSAIGKGYRISELPLDNRGLLSARSMLENCISHHTRCNSRHSKAMVMPRRVLDLFAGKDLKDMRLRDSEGVATEQRQDYGEYVALSHVWGSGQRLPRLTKSTLQAFKKNVPWPMLPLALQQVVLLTRAMRIRWLWIDSLCLIQDDIQEKLEESMQMDQIYGNAFLTIAATSTSDSSIDPLFPTKLQPSKLQVIDDKGLSVNIHVREQPSHYSFKAPFEEVDTNDEEAPFNITQEANLHTPLLTRAWAYTERLLSPRLLHFTTSEMIFECREGYQCECGRIENTAYDPRANDRIKSQFAQLSTKANSHSTHDQTDNRESSRLDTMTSQLASTSFTSDPHALSRAREQALRSWSHILTEFTARGITHDADRLVALASIAKMLSPVMQSGYIAGQWTFSTLGLLWHPSNSTQSRRTSAPSGQVPSWSWASVEGSPILSDTVSAMDLACRVYFGAKGKRAPAWSPLLGEPIVLAAAMAAPVSFYTASASASSSASSSSSASASASTAPPIYLLERNDVTVEFTPDIVPLRGEDAIQEGEQLTCLLVSMTFRSSILGLVLRPQPSGTYRRVGRLECYECTPQGAGGQMREDAENLFQYWFPEIQDMTLLDSYPQRCFTVV